MILYLIFSCLLVLAYLGYLHYHKQASEQTHNVSIQFKRSARIYSDHRSDARSEIDHAERRNESTLTTPNGGTFIRNRNQSRSSGINYISPNSIYGYMPKSNILSERIKSKEHKKEFTVKLSLFPHMTRNLKSPNLALNSPPSESINNSVNHSFLNGSITHNISQNTDRTPTASISMPRLSIKRPIFSNESSEDDFLLKKSKNQLLDDIDLDDSEMFDEAGLEESVPNTKKAMKRSTLAFESEAPLNLPLKRVKNNEILSSYSSTSVSQSRHLLNKRKFQYSPDDSVANTKVKKRTYIEELELLTSDMSPYYRNIYNPQPESTPKNTASAFTSLTTSDISQSTQSSATKSQLQSNQLKDKLTGQEPIEMIELNDVSDDDDTESQDVEIIEPEEEEVKVEDTEQKEPIVSPISSHVFSIKDHEYDKKKSTNRLNRFLAAVQQGSESSDAALTADKEPTAATAEVDDKSKVFVDSNITTISTVVSTAPFSFGTNTNSQSSTLNENSAPKPSEPAGLTTTIVLSSTNETKLAALPIEPKPAAPLLPPALAPATTTSVPLSIASPKTDSLQISSFAAQPSSPLKVNATLPPLLPPSVNNTSINFNFSSINSSSFVSPSSIVPANKSTVASSPSTFAFGTTSVGANSNPSPAPLSTTFAFGANTNSSQPLTFSLPDQKATDLSTKPLVQPATMVSIPTNVSSAPKLAFNFSATTSSNASNITTNTSSSASTFPSMPTFTNPTFAAPSQAPNAPVKSTSNTFAFGQPSGASSMTSPPKPSFDFTSIKPLSFDVGSTSLPTSLATPSGTLSSTLTFNTSTNMFASNVASNGFKNGIDAFSKPAVPTTNTSNSAFSFSAAAAPSFHTNMFSFNATKPLQSMTQNSSSRADNGFDFKPAVSGTFDFKAAASGAAPSNGGFNFSSAASSMGNSGGFNFGKQPAAAPSLTAAAAPFAFGSTAPTSMPLVAPSSVPPFAFNVSAAKPNGFTFGASNQSANSMFQFNGK